MLKTEVMTKKQTGLEVERNSDLQKVSCILENNENTFREINNNFLEVISPILRYHHNQNRGYVGKTNKSRN